jgi:hypothetical protein
MNAHLLVHRQRRVGGIDVEESGAAVKRASGAGFPPAAIGCSGRRSTRVAPPQSSTSGAGRSESRVVLTAAVVVVSVGIEMVRGPQGAPLAAQKTLTLSALIGDVLVVAQSRPSVIELGWIRRRR